MQTDFQGMKIGAWSVSACRHECSWCSCESTGVYSVYSSLFIYLFFTQNYFNSAILVGFRIWIVRLRSCHSISVGFKSWLWLGHSNHIFILFLLGNSWRSCAWSSDHGLMTRHSPWGFSSREHNSRFHQLWQVAQNLQSIPTSAHKSPLFTAGMMILLWNTVSFTPDAMRHFWLIIKHHPKRLGGQQGVFWQMWDEPLCSSWLAVFYAPFSYQALSNGGIMNLIWGERGLQILQICLSGFRCDFPDFFQNFGMPATLGKIQR